MKLKIITLTIGDIILNRLLDQKNAPFITFVDYGLNGGDTFVRALKTQLHNNMNPPTHTNY